MLSAAWNLAENAHESLKMGADPADYGVEHKEDLTWEKAVKHGLDTLLCAIHEDGIAGAIENAYIFDEGDDDQPTGLADCDQQEVERFVGSLRGTRDAEGRITIAAV